MACDRLRELALLDVDDGLAADERAELEAHLAGCADCRAARDAARRVARGVRQLPVPPVPLGFKERTLQRIERADSVAARPRGRIVRFAAAAAIVAAAAVFWFEQRFGSEKTALQDQIASRAPIAGDERRDAGEPRGEVGATGEQRKADAVDGPAELKKQAQERSLEDQKARAVDDAKPPEGEALRQGEESERARTVPTGGGERDGKPGAAGAEMPGKLEEKKDFEAEESNAPAEAAAPAPAAPAPAGAPTVETLVRELALGTPAEALRRIESLADADRWDAPKDEERRQAPKPEGWAEGASNEKRANEAAKADKEEKEKAPAPPPLRFVRAHVDPARLAELIGARGEALARDDSRRLVLELTEDEAKALETRLLAAGVKLETLVASDWLAALQESAAATRLRAAGAVARGGSAKPASEPPSAPPKTPGAPPLGKSRDVGGAPKGGDADGATKGEAPTTGARKGEAPATGPRRAGAPKPVARVRWIVLAGA